MGRFTARKFESPPDVQVIAAEVIRTTAGVFKNYSWHQQSPVKLFAADRILINPNVRAGIQQQRGSGGPSVHIRRSLDLIGSPDSAGDFQAEIGIQLQAGRRRLCLRVEGNVADPVVAGVGDEDHALRQAAAGSVVEAGQIAGAVDITGLVKVSRQSHHIRLRIHFPDTVSANEINAAGVI